MRATRAAAERDHGRDGTVRATSVGAMGRFERDYERERDGPRLEYEYE